MISRSIRWICCICTNFLLSSDSSNASVLGSIFQTADVCTLVYGVSELLDYNSTHTQHLLSLLASTLPCNASLLIVDPVSHQFCCEKETLILRHLSTSCHWHTSYRGHDKVSVSRSLLEPAITSYCQLLGLHINRDVKLSCHTWKPSYDEATRSELATIWRSSTLTIFTISAFESFYLTIVIDSSQLRHVL